MNWHFDPGDSGCQSRLYSPHVCREFCLTTAYLNRIGTAVPGHDVHSAFVHFAEEMLVEKRTRSVFSRMARLSEILHRYSFLQADSSAVDVCGDATSSSGLADRSPKSDSTDAGTFYQRGSFPSTGERMRIFERFAPRLAGRALDRLRLSGEELQSIRHVIVTSCTGLYAPGLDFEIADYLGLPRSVERTMIGFMGCYAAMNALKLARHIVRSEPNAGVLVVNLELCTLHFQETQDLEQVLSFLVFSDGCAASLVSNRPSGFALDSFHAVQIPETRELIQWRIRELGFDMMLSGKVPREVGRALRAGAEEIIGPGGAASIDLWGVHPGGRSVLDAVEEGLALAPGALAASREILCRYGNMSSATVMFVLQRLMEQATAGQRGCAMSFGPGLTAETLRFHVAEHVS